MEKLNIGNEKVKQFKHKLAFGKVKIVMTEEEWEMLNEMYNKYVEKHGVTFGFVRWFLGDRKID